MKYNTIINPETGKKVLLNSHLGKLILKKYIIQLHGSSRALKNVARTVKDTAKNTAVSAQKITSKAAAEAIGIVIDKVQNLLSPFNNPDFMELAKHAEQFIRNTLTTLKTGFTTEYLDNNTDVLQFGSTKNKLNKIYAYISLILLNIDINKKNNNESPILSDTSLEKFNFNSKPNNMDFLHEDTEYSHYADKIYEITKKDPFSDKPHIELIKQNTTHADKTPDTPSSSDPDPESNITEFVYNPFYALYIDSNLKSIILVIRGTTDLKDALIDLLCETVEFKIEDHICHVHKGCFDASKKIVKSIREDIKKYMSANNDYKLVVTGHSLGGGVATVIGILLYIDDFFKSESNDKYFVIDSIPRKIQVKAFAPGSTFTQSDDELVNSQDPLTYFLKKHSRVTIDGYIYNADVVPRASAYSMINFMTVAQILRYLLIEKDKSIPGFNSAESVVDQLFTFIKTKIESKSPRMKRVTNMAALNRNQEKSSVTPLLEYTEEIIKRSSDLIETYYKNNTELKYNQLRTLLPGDKYLLINKQGQYHIQNINSTQLGDPILFVSEQCLDNHHMEHYTSALTELSKYIDKKTNRNPMDELNDKLKNLFIAINN